VAGIALAGLVGGVVKSTVALGANTVAWVRNTAAALASKAQTVALAAIYAGSFIAGIVRATASWVSNTAALVANKAAVVGQTIAAKAMSWSTFIGMQVRATASWVANTASIVANKVAMVAQSVASKAVVAGQAAMRIGQLALNAAMRA